MGYYPRKLWTPQKQHADCVKFKKKEKEKTIMLNPYTPRKLWLILGYILFYMYILLTVSSKILMHTIKPLHKKAPTKMYSCTFMQKFLKFVHLSFFVK